jgi:hypothetical protein
MKTTSRWQHLRNALVASAFIGAMGFGTMQAVATDAPADRAACGRQWQCDDECGPLGGHLGPGGPGQPLECYCCG